MILKWIFLTYLLLSIISPSLGGDKNSKLKNTGNKEQLKIMTKKIQKRFPSVPVMTPQTLKKEMLTKNIILLDVRPEKERKISVIPGSISLKIFHENKNKYKGKKIVAYCTIGYRSSKHAEILNKLGFNVYNLEGSLLGWINEGGHLETLHGKSTKRVFIYGGSQFLPQGYSPALNP